jgi:hypothetical protein
MPANLFVAIRPYEGGSRGESCRRIHLSLFAHMKEEEVGANHAGEFIRRYSPFGSENGKCRTALCPLRTLCETINSMRKHEKNIVFRKILRGTQFDNRVDSGYNHFRFYGESHHNLRMG